MEWRATGNHEPQSVSLKLIRTFLSYQNCSAQPPVRLLNSSKYRNRRRARKNFRRGLVDRDNDL